MKKYIYSFAVCAALFCTSCDESRLNIEQKAVSSTENFYKTDQDAIDAMTAAYAQFLDNVCSSAGIYQPQFTLLNYSADDVFSAGTDYVDHMDIRVFDEFRYDTGNAALKELYQRYYKSIYASNLVITCKYDYGSLCCRGPRVTRLLPHDGCSHIPVSSKSRQTAWRR